MLHSDAYNQILEDYRAHSFGWVDHLVFRQRKEILDTDPEGDAALRVIRDLEKFGKLFSLPNQLAGQLAATLRSSVRKHVAMLEVCGGSCWFSRSVIDSLPAIGIDLAVTGTDWSRHCIANYSKLYQHPKMTWEVADATSLPYTDKQFDIAVNIQALHHFEPNMVVRVLSEMFRVADKVMLFDIRRTWYGSSFVAAFTPFFSHEFINDGIISHRRAYSVKEIQFLIDQADLPLRARNFLPVGMLIESDPK